MESNLRLCKVCQQLKQRIEDGRYNSKDKKYKDENGQAWNGSTCPPCNKARVKEAMRKKRSNENP